MNTQAPGLGATRRTGLALQRARPLSGRQFIRALHGRTINAIAPLSYTPPSVGRWLASAPHEGTRSTAPSQMPGFVKLLVAAPLSERGARERRSRLRRWSRQAQAYSSGRRQRPESRRDRLRFAEQVQGGRGRGRGRPRPGPVFRTLAWEALTERTEEGPNDRALRLLVRRTPPPVRGAARGGAGAGADAPATRAARCIARPASSASRSGWLRSAERRDDLREAAHGLRPLRVAEPDDRRLHAGSASSR